MKDQCRRCDIERVQDVPEHACATLRGLPRVVSVQPEWCRALSVQQQSVLLLATRGPKTGHPELREMIANGMIPIPTHRQHAGASVDISMSLIRNAERLGVLELIE